LRNYEESQSPADHHQGWRYFFERTDLKAGTDPAQATLLRQADLEQRECKAVQEMNAVLGRRGMFG
jgi:hypothetical protein